MMSKEKPATAGQSGAGQSTKGTQIVACGQDITSAPSTENQGSQHAVQAAWLRRARGQAIKACPIDGKALTSTFLAADTFTLAIQPVGQEPVLLFKQMIAFIALPPAAGTGGGR